MHFRDTLCTQTIASTPNSREGESPSPRKREGSDSVREGRETEKSKKNLSLLGFKSVWVWVCLGLSLFGFEKERGKKCESEKERGRESESAREESESAREGSDSERGECFRERGERERPKKAKKKFELVWVCLGLSLFGFRTCRYVRPCISLNTSNWALKLCGHILEYIYGWFMGKHFFRFFGPYKAGPCLDLPFLAHKGDIELVY